MNIIFTYPICRVFSVTFHCPVGRNVPCMTTLTCNKSCCYTLESMTLNWTHLYRLCTISQRTQKRMQRHTNWTQIKLFFLYRNAPLSSLYNVKGIENIYELLALYHFYGPRASKVMRKPIFYPLNKIAFFYYG